MALTLAEIVQALGGNLHGNPRQSISRLSTLESASASELDFLAQAKYQSQLSTTRAGCVIVSPQVPLALRASLKSRIETDDPYLYFARLTQLWKQIHSSKEEPLRHPTAYIHDQAQVDPTARIGPFCVVEKGAKVGANTWLKSHVTVGEHCVVGDRCILHAGVSIGADGFGFAPHQGQWIKIEQLGAVRIGNDVEIGAANSACADPDPHLIWAGDGGCTRHHDERCAWLPEFHGLHCGTLHNKSAQPDIEKWPKISIYPKTAPILDFRQPYPTGRGMM